VDANTVAVAVGGADPDGGSALTSSGVSIVGEDLGVNVFQGFRVEPLGSGRFVAGIA